MPLSQVNVRIFLKNWRWVIIYVALIYITLPLLPFLWNSAVSVFGRRFDYIPSVLLFVFGFVIVFRVILRHKKLLSYIYLAIIFILVSLIFLNLKLPVERIHIFEYGILPFLIGRSLKEQGVVKYINLKNFLIGFVIGIIDEFIQFILPNRYCSASDILLNGISVLLGLLVWMIIGSRSNQKITA